MKQHVEGWSCEARTVVTGCFPVTKWVNIIAVFLMNPCELYEVLEDYGKGCKCSFNGNECPDCISLISAHNLPLEGAKGLSGECEHCKH
jgi:hypothetical protein